MTTYKSKLGLELVIPLSIILCVVGGLVYYDANWLGLAVILLVALFIIHLFLTTYYQIDGNHLRIRSGFIINQTLEISAITKIMETNNPSSSPATSLDRLEIYYNKFDSVVISPKNKSGFISELKSIKPNIEVHLKNSMKSQLLK